MEFVQTAHNITNSNCCEVRSARCRLEPSVRARSHASLTRILPALVANRRFDASQALSELARRRLPRMINENVYKLYNLDAKDIEIVEQKTAASRYK